jgi:hypothetical protein
VEQNNLKTAEIRVKSGYSERYSSDAAHRKSLESKPKGPSRAEGASKVKFWKVSDTTLSCRLSSIDERGMVVNSFSKLVVSYDVAKSETSRVIGCESTGRTIAYLPN